MTEPTEPETPDYPDLVNRNVKAAIAFAGFRPKDVEKVLGMAHATAHTRFSGQQEWKLSELPRIAAWLGIELSKLTSIP